MEQISSFFATIWSYLYTTTPVTSTGIIVPVPIEYAATIVGAISGTLFAVDKKFDVLGAITLAVAAGLGGGMTRDILLQTHGIYAFQEPMIIVAVIIASIVAFYFSGLFKHMDSIMFLLDAVSVALFAFLGTDKGLQAGLSFIPVVILGTITAVGGGAVRDILAREVPSVFKQGNFYGTAALAGAFAYALCSFSHLTKWFGLIVCLLVTLSLRYLSVIFDWRTNVPRDFTPQVRYSVKTFINEVFLHSGDPRAHATATTTKMAAIKQKQSKTGVEAYQIEDENAEIERLLDSLAADDGDKEQGGSN